MGKLHFEHGSEDGSYEDAYKDMLVESKATEQAAMEARQIAYYRDLVARKASLIDQIDRLEETPVIKKHLGKK